jgi:carbon-monoxide dehydrogenase medium subunit
MYPQVIDSYFLPRSIEEAVSHLHEHGAEASVLAGGQSLIGQLKARILAPRALVDINRIPELQLLEFSASGLRCSATVRMATIAGQWEQSRRFGALADAAAAVGDRQVRSRGTLLGNVEFAAHWGDIAPAAVALGGQVELVGHAGRRTLPVCDYIIGPGHTERAPEELAIALHFPLPALGSAYLKHGRVAQDRATIGVAAAVGLDEASRVHSLSVVIGGLSTHPATDLSQPLIEAAVGRMLDGTCLRDLGELAAETTSPQDDELASADYRRQLLRVYVPRAIVNAAQRSEVLNT